MVSVLLCFIGCGERLFLLRGGAGVLMNDNHTVFEGVHVFIFESINSHDGQG